MTDGNSASGLGTGSAYPRISQAVGLVVLALVLALLLNVPIRILAPSHKNHPVAIAIVHTLAFGVVVRWGYRKTASSFRDVFPLKPFGLSFVAPMVLILLGVIILVAEMKYVVEMVWPKPASLIEFLQSIGRWSVWGALVATVVVAPVTEEFLFRGLILHGFLRNYSRRKALVVSALLFALFHLNPWQFPGAFIMGVVFGWWMIETGSLLPCLFGHALVNLVPIFVGWMAGRNSMGHSGPEAGAGWPPVWFGVLAVVGALFFGTGAWLLRRRGVRSVRG